ncbi:MAG: hypothetical protein R6W71_03225, partial [Bacteroidales bacterium]
DWGIGGLGDWGIGGLDDLLFLCGGEYSCMLATRLKQNGPLKKAKHMTPKTKILFLIFLTFWVSCDKANNKPSDQFTLKSNQYTGFSFEVLKVIDFPFNGNLKPDFLVAPHILVNGDVVSPFFSHPDLESRFFLSGTYENYENALTDYNSFVIPDNYQFEQFAFGVKPNQIWLINTNENKSGIILIISAKFNNDNDTPYAETTFKARIVD